VGTTRRGADDEGVTWSVTVPRDVNEERETHMKESLGGRWRMVRRRVDAGMTTAEYAVGTLAACGFAVVLLAIVRSGPVKAAMTKVITTALGVAG